MLCCFHCCQMDLPTGIMKLCCVVLNYTACSTRLTERTLRLDNMVCLERLTESHFVLGHDAEMVLLPTDKVDGLQLAGVCIQVVQTSPLGSDRLSAFHNVASDWWATVILGPFPWQCSWGQIDITDLQWTYGSFWALYSRKIHWRQVSILDFICLNPLRTHIKTNWR